MTSKIEIIEFIRDQIITQNNIEESHIIGSFVESEIYNDVDLIILFKHNKDIFELIQLIKKMKFKFKNRFKKNLHVSGFSSRESTFYNTFKLKNSLIYI